MSDEILEQYLKFDEYDLQANRLGQLSGKQKARLAQKDKSTKTWFLIGGIFLLGIAALGLIITLVAVILFKDIILKVGVGLGVGCTWPLIWGGIGVLLLLRAFRKYKVVLRSAKGPINIIKVEKIAHSRHGSRHYFVYEMHIGGVKLIVKPDLADIMMQGDVYTIYYAEGSENEILSAELISKAH
jgi:hypothetical protein